MERRGKSRAWKERTGRHLWAEPAAPGPQGIAINEKGQALDNNNQPMEGLYITGDMSGSFFANNYPCLMAGVAMGRTLTFAMKAVKQMAGLDNA